MTELSLMMQQGQWRSGWIQLFKMTYKVMVTSTERDFSLCCCNSEDTINQVSQQAVLVTLIAGLLYRQWSQTALTLALFMGLIESTSTPATLALPVHGVYESCPFQHKHHIPAVSSWWQENNQRKWHLGFWVHQAAIYQVKDGGL